MIINVDLLLEELNIHHLGGLAGNGGAPGDGHSPHRFNLSNLEVKDLQSILGSVAPQGLGYRS